MRQPTSVGAGTRRPDCRSTKRQKSSAATRWCSRQRAGPRSRCRLCRRRKSDSAANFPGACPARPSRRRTAPVLSTHCRQKGTAPVVGPGPLGGCFLVPLGPVPNHLNSGARLGTVVLKHSVQKYSALLAPGRRKRGFSIGSGRYHAAVARMRIGIDTAIGVRQSQIVEAVRSGCRAGVSDSSGRYGDQTRPGVPRSPGLVIKQPLGRQV